MSNKKISVYCHSFKKAFTVEVEKESEEAFRKAIKIFASNNKTKYRSKIEGHLGKHFYFTVYPKGKRKDGPHSYGRFSCYYSVTFDTFSVSKKLK